VQLRVQPVSEIVIVTSGEAKTGQATRASDKAKPNRRSGAAVAVWLGTGLFMTVRSPG
jgi:hypothetical protein